MTTIRTWIGAITLCVYFAGPVIAQEALRDMNLVDGPADPSTSIETKYRKKWIVAVGINYRSEDRVGAIGDVPRLHHAEPDARAFHELLVEKFAFAEEDARLLVGADATHSKIRESVGELANDKRVTSEDCVVVYFSGHGVLQRAPSDNAQRGYLIPIDVKWGDDNQPNPGSAIDMSEIVRMLSDCGARHKLLIFDCCHSGVVFRIDEGVAIAEFDHEEMGRDVFSSPGFQAITASRDNQKASDGRNGHSPFTNALLESLKTLPLQNERALGQRSFTASQLFVKMKPYLSGEGQSPQCRRLNADQGGELYFLPDPDADFSEGVVDENSRNELLAMAPTTFGNWWAYEVPWFMPGLRLAILQNNAPTRSAIEELDRTSLEDAARQAEQKAKSASTELDPLFEMRYRHLNMLLDAPAGERQLETMHKIVSELERHAVKSNESKVTLEAEDLHYLAVLYQLLGDSEAAGKRYSEALATYEKRSNASRNKLRALCLLDAGMFSLSRNDLGIAKKRIQAARQQFEGQAPKPFEIYALCREAELYRREGKFGMSWSRMEQAVDLRMRWDPDATTLLSANTMKTRAWANMEGWDFKKAKDDFLATQQILNNESHQSRFEAKIDRFHVRHGLAMIERYQGRTPEALAEYRKLTPDIAKELRDLENRRDVDLPNYAEIRALLTERAVNSLERQADCLLFGEAPDYADAADDYRRAINECESLSKSNRDRQRVDLLYRRSLALCLHVASQDCEVGELPYDALDIELATELTKEANELCASMEQLKTLKQLPRKTILVKSLAEACLNALKAVEEEGKELIAKAPDEFTVNPSTYDRDELERLMFFYKTLITHRKLFRTPAYDSQKHIALLLTLCRSACRLEKPDPELLAYLRPYYDAAFIAQSELLPRHTKELIEIAAEATRGTPYMKPATIHPLMVLHVAGGKCHLLLDAPGGPSNCYIIEDVESRQQLLAASASQEYFTLPDEIRHALREIQLRRPNDRVVIRWRDPVLRLGVNVPMLSDTDSKAPTQVVTRYRPDVDQATSNEPESSEFAFPFSLRGILKPDQIVEDSIETEAKVGASESPAAGPSETELNEKELSLSH